MRTSPAYDSEGSPLSEPILLTLNQSFENIKAAGGNTIFNSNNIKVKCAGIDITDCFHEPILTDTMDYIEITPYGYKLNEFFIKKGITIADCIVQLIPEQMSFYINEKNIPFAENIPLNYTFCYTNIGADTIAPVKTSLDFYKKDPDISENLTPENRFVTLGLSYSETFDAGSQSKENNPYLSDDAIINARTNGTVYIKGQYTDDSESGINSVFVEEQYIFTHQANQNPDVFYSSTTYKEGNDNVLLWDNGSFIIKHNIQVSDSVVELKVSVNDSFGNTAEPVTMQVIKVSEIDFSLIGLTNYFFYDYSNEITDFDMQTYLNNLKNVKLIYPSYYSGLCFDDYSLCPKYCDRFFEPTNYYKSITCSYYDDDGVLHNDTMNIYEYEAPYEGAKNWNCNIENVEDISGLPVTITIKDDLGNVNSRIYTFPQKISVCNIQGTENPRVSLYSPDTKYPKGLVVFKEDEEDDNSWKVLPFNNSQPELDNNHIYQFINYDWDNPLLASDLSKKYENPSSENLIQNTIELNGIITFTPLTTTEESFICINIPIKKSAWNNYDKIIVRLSNDTSYIDHNATFYFEDKETELNLFQDFRYLFILNPDDKIIINGINKKGQISAAKEISLYDYLPENRNELDTIPPSITRQLQNVGNDRIQIFIRDYETGIKKADFFIDDILYHSTENFINTYKYYKFQELINNRLPKYELNSNYLTLKFKAEDKNGNITEKVYTTNTIDKNAPVYVYNKSNDSWTFYSEEEITQAGFKLELFAKVSNKWKWTQTSKNFVVGTEDELSTINCPTTFFKNKFIRITNGYSVPKYYYAGLTENGDYKNSGRYDKLRSTADKNKFIVASDAPVLVHTIYTTEPYNTCSLWTQEDWEFYIHQTGEEFFNFVAQNQKEYTVPELPDGCCYVVVAYFADGTSQMSNVMVK